MIEYKEKNVAVLGSTGSVGEQALDVADRLSMNVTSISAHRNYRRVEEQARKLLTAFSLRTYLSFNIFRIKQGFALCSKQITLQKASVSHTFC